MTEKVEKATKAKTLDDATLNDAALDKAVGGTGKRVHTGGRFQLDIGSYSVGYLKKFS
jgi:hypothetical protein